MLDVEKFVGGLHAYMERAFRPLVDRLKALEDRAGDTSAIEAVVRREVASLPAPAPGRDGKDAPPVDTPAIVREVLAMVPPARDGKDGRDGRDADPVVVSAEVAKAMAAHRLSDADRALIVKDAVADAEARIVAATRDGGIRDAIKAAVSELPRPADGRDGKDADPEVIRAEVARAVAAMPPPQDGAAGKDGAPGRDGRDGKDGAPGERGPVGERGERGEKGMDGRDGINGKDGAPGIDGRSVTLDDVRPLLEAEVARHVLEIERRSAETVQRAIDRLPVPKDGAPGRDGRDGVDGKDGAAGVNGRDGSDGLHGKDGAPGRDGVDGFGFDDLVVEQRDEGRTMVLRFVRGDRQREFELRTFAVIDRGVYKSGAYMAGDAVTYGGSLWIAQRDTSDVPGSDSKDWRLAVKRGRDGKDATP